MSKWNASPFPRTRTEEQICLADYFAPVSSGQMDVVALQVVTVGQAATDRFDRLQEEGDYSRGLLYSWDGSPNG